MKRLEELGLFGLKKGKLRLDLEMQACAVCGTKYLFAVLQTARLAC